MKFIKTRLDGKALEAIDSDVDSVDELIQQLKNAIKPDNSKIITGRMMALKIDRTKIQEYSKQAEELADALKRTLIFEGIPSKNAQEMTIEKTIEMCRASTRSDVVRSILGAATFSGHKEVIAKLIVESERDKSEKQVLSFQKFNKRSNNNFQHNKFQNRANFNNRGRGGARGRFNSNGNNRNFAPRQFNNNTQFRGNGRGGYNGGRGRGNYNIRVAQDQGQLGFSQMPPQMSPQIQNPQNQQM